MDVFDLTEQLELLIDSGLEPISTSSEVSGADIGRIVVEFSGGTFLVQVAAV